MATERQHDDEVAEELLDLLRDDTSETPDDLTDKTIRQVRALITTKDLIDLTTIVFVLRFCAPLIDLIVGVLGGKREDPPGAPEPPTDRSTEK